MLGDTIVEHAESAGVNIPTNCTRYLWHLHDYFVIGDVPLPDVLPPGLDDYMVEQNARLAVLEFLLAIVKSTFVRHCE